MAIVSETRDGHRGLQGPNLEAGRAMQDDYEAEQLRGRTVKSTPRLSDPPLCRVDAF
jgi:hypothetical protein